jgi:hypothetical protein
VVYIGNLNDAHHPCTLRALDKGKHVLCEKPFAVNTQQVREMVAKAKEKNLFLMEVVHIFVFILLNIFCNISGIVGQILPGLGIHPPIGQVEGVWKVASGSRQLRHSIGRVSHFSSVNQHKSFIPNIILA